MNGNLLEECELIQQNATYTAEAHHIIAEWQRRLAIGVQLIPAVTAAITSTLMVAGFQDSNLLWVTMVSSIIAASASVLNPHSQAQAHLDAAKAFSILKHNARYLRCVRSNSVTEEAFALLVEHLHEKYNDVVRSAPPTGKITFNLASQKVKAGVHSPDPLSGSSKP